MRQIGLLVFVLSWYFSFSQQETKLIAPGAQLTKAGSGYKFTEGPAVDPNGNVYFTDQPNDRIYVWSPDDGQVSLWAEGLGRSNGMYFDQQGVLISCADFRNQLWRIKADKTHDVLVGKLDGKYLNGPNDLWITPQGDIYFTDPFYKRDWWDHSEKEIPQENVYYLKNGTQDPQIAAGDFVRPNGIIGTKNGKLLYVADINDKKTYVFKIQKDGRLSERKLFCNLGSDGMTIDHRGNVYLTGKGVTIFDNKGRQIGHIDVPENWTANVTFGGKKEEFLFITAMGAVYTLPMQVHGIRWR